MSNELSEYQIRKEAAEKHFSTGWRGVSYDAWESVHVDQYDPTYGSSHTTRNLYLCQTCAALTPDPEDHAMWHESQS
jgi:hypothetical protein